MIVPLTELHELPMDFVMSIGPACRPAQQLKTAGLRFTAAPMDWMQQYPLEAVTHCFQTGFSDFFAQIEEIPQEKPRKFRRVVDRGNDICSIHHFPADQSLEQGQRQVQATMTKRYRRIHKLLSGGKRIGFVGNRSESRAELLKFLGVFHNLYPQAELVLLNVRHVDADGIAMTKTVQGPCTLYEIFFRDEHPDGTDIAANAEAWHGNSFYWQQVLEQIVLRRSKQGFLSRWFKSR